MKTIENLRKSMQINTNQLIPPLTTPPHREGEAPHPCGVGGPAHRHAFQALQLEIAGSPMEEPDPYCWSWESFEDKVMEAFEAESMEEPYKQLQAWMEKNPEKAKTLREEAVKNMNNPEGLLTISLKQLKEKGLSSMD